MSIEVVYSAAFGGRPHAIAIGGVVVATFADRADAYAMAHRLRTQPPITVLAA